MGMLKKETHTHACTDQQPIISLSGRILSCTDLKQIDLLLLLNWGQISPLKAWLYCWACLLFMISENAMVTWAVYQSLGCFMYWISSSELQFAILINLVSGKLLYCIYSWRIFTADTCHRMYLTTWLRFMLGFAHWRTRSYSGKCVIPGLFGELARLIITEVLL